jgi:hypothetical protein
MENKANTANSADLGYEAELDCMAAAEKETEGLLGAIAGDTPEPTRKGHYGGTIPFIRSAEFGCNSTERCSAEEGLMQSLFPSQEAV